MPSATADLVASGRSVTKDAAWIEETLKAHNECRAKHCVPPLVWDDDCARQAEKAAENCAEANAMMHTEHSEHGHGQNVFAGTTGFFGAKEAVEAWYSEVTNPGYKWDQQGSPDGCPGCGHFTQVVWRDSVKVGMACDSQKKGFIVANYSPAGNMMGTFNLQVFPSGTPLQERAKVRNEPFQGVVKDGSPELEEILGMLEAVKQTSTIQTIRGSLAEGWDVTLNFRPNPNGVLQYQCKKGGSMKSGSCSF